MSDSTVNIANYQIYRRDRNCFGQDNRSKGGIAVYVRSNLRVIDIFKSRLYELICLTIELPSGHRLFLCGVYHPPKFDYKELDLMRHIVDLADNTLDLHPNTVIVCGGDLNKLNLNQLQQLSGWNVLVDFPTRGKSCLDNVLTNRKDLFGKCYPLNMLIKTDHLGVILPAGLKLKPIRRKVRREHRKQAFYRALENENWDQVMCIDNPDHVVERLEATILGHLNYCTPQRVVSMSSRDPSWMSPLVKSLLKKKAKVSINDNQRLEHINNRISQIISDNKKHLLVTPTGSCKWWK